MVPHKVEIGERYGDDSGWSRLVYVDRQKDSVTISADGNSMTCKIEDAVWIVNALCAALKNTATE